MSKISRNDYILQIQNEKGQNPQSWFNLISHDLKIFDTSKNLKLFEKALTTIPTSISITSAHYLELWKLFSKELKTLDFGISKEIFQRLEKIGHLKKNAYFYSCFFNVAMNKKYLEEARGILKRGLENMAQPSAIISSSFKLLASISRNQNRNNLVENNNKENLDPPNQSNHNKSIIAQSAANQQIFQSPLSKKPSLSELKTIQTPPTRKIFLSPEILNKLIPPPLPLPTTEPETQSPHFPELPSQPPELSQPQSFPSDPPLDIVEFPRNDLGPSPQIPENNSNDNSIVEQPPQILPQLEPEQPLLQELMQVEQLPPPPPQQQQQSCSPVRKKKKTLPMDSLQFGSRIQLTEWQSHVIFVNKKIYLKLNRIGSGGSSKVYKVLDENGNIFAIKQVSLNNVDNIINNGYVEEIKLLERLKNYSGIIKLHGYELKAEEKVLNIILEFGEVDLAKLLAKSGPLLHKGGENYLRMYWQQMLEAVRILHDQERIIHGDLKPQNFVSVRSYLRLIDFGIAKAIHTDTMNIHANNIMGTLNYIAPEILGNHCKGKTKYGTASDIWSLGCIFYQMIYGKPPLQTYDYQATINWLRDPNQTLHQFPLNPITNEPIPAIVEEVLVLCLQKDPNKRPTCTQLLNHAFLCPLMSASTTQSLIIKN